MSDQYDGFGDVIDGTPGVFEGAGFSAHDTASATPTNEGVAIEMTCEGCGAPLQIIVAWAELVALKYGISPHMMSGDAQLAALASSEWGFDRSAARPGWFPVLPCRKCQHRRGGAQRLRFAAGEPERYLTAGRQRAFPFFRKRGGGMSAEDYVSQYAHKISQSAR